MQFLFDHSLVRFHELSREGLLSALQDKTTTPLDGLASGAVIFKPLDPVPQVLLVQRAPADSMPLRWEVPGGAVDKGESVLLGASREVQEETGMIVSRVEALVAHERGTDDELDGGCMFRTTRGKTVVKFTFVVQVGSQTSPVKLDPKEHVDYVWATEEECRARRVRRKGGAPEGEDYRGNIVEIEFTTAAQEAAVLRAFEWRKGRDRS